MDSTNDTFRLNGTSKEDKAILLSKTLSIDGVSMATEDTMGRLMSECLKINDIVHFDCHIYDKLGTVGSGKDRSVKYSRALHPTSNFFWIYDSECICNIHKNLITFSFFAGVIFMQ